MDEKSEWITYKSFKRKVFIGTENPNRANFPEFIEKKYLYIRRFPGFIGTHPQKRIIYCLKGRCRTPFKEES